jgi:D-amino-acid oxidase
MGQAVLERRRTRTPDGASSRGAVDLRTRGSKEGKETPGKKPEAAVLGAGIIGLVTALTAQKDFNVTIYSDKDPLETTSAKAGAVFEPFHPGNMSVEQMNEWVRTGMDWYNNIIDSHPESETGMRRHTLYSTSTGLLVAENVPFLPAIPGSKIITGDGVPGGGHYQSATVLPDVAMIDPTKALPFLVKEFVRRGGTIKTDVPTVTDFAEFVKQTPEKIIFNCTGLGARELINDPELVPVRGQIVVAKGQITEPVLGGTNSMLGDDIFYIFPRSDTTILGGTLEHGEEAEVTTDAAIRRILKRTRELIPGFNPDRDILRTYAGLRPFRPSGPLVREGKYSGQYKGVKKKVIDVIGFGGSGLTFAPGAADSALKLVK